jgi:glycosyltransferase involved in cell wall biosynthesis
VRVLHVINSLVAGGAERLLSDLLPALAGLGVECEVLALDERGDAFSPALRAAGIEVRFARAGGASPYSPARLLDIGREIRRFRPDIVHSHLGPSFHWCALASLALRRPRYLTTEHASENRRMRMPLLRGFERFCYGRYDRVAAVSRESAEAIADWLGLGSERFAVIPNGIPLARFAAPAAPAEDVKRALRGRLGVAMVARLVPPKDHATALAALALLPDEYCLVLAGEGPEREAIEAEAERLNVTERCLLLGSRADVPAVLAACRVYLQSSKVEGFGIAALEAMAAGLPVVASEARGLGELVRGAGLLFPVGDAGTCARAIQRIVAEPALAKRLVEAGRARAAEYSIERCAGAYAALYAELLKEGA